MKKIAKRWIALFSLVILLASMVIVPPSAEAVAAYEFYGDYTDVAKIYDYSSCPSIQGLAVGSQKLYTIKINSTDDGAFISMTDKDSGDTEKLYNSDAGSYLFDYLGHANDMDVWGIDGSSHLFVTTTNKGSQAIVRLKRSGSNLTKVAQYRLTCDGEDICATAMSIMGVSNGTIKLLTKWGMQLYTGSVSTSATSATIEMTKLCKLSKSQAYIKDTYNDLSSYVNQGMGYHNGMLYLPLSGDDSNLNRSVILVYNLENASGTVYPIEHLSFRVTSGAYSALFELESCDICSADGKLYFSVQRRVTSSDTNHDGVASFDGYTFSQVTSQTTHYTVQYDANGGTGTMDDTYVSYGYKVPLRTNTFTRSGYSFAGWAAHRKAQDQWYYTDGTNSGWYAEGSQPDGYSYYIYSDGVTVAKSTAVDNDVVTMYAQWTPLASTYTIKYDPNGGTGTMADTEVVYGYNTPLRTNTFTRSGYTFVGWTAYRTTKGQWYYTDGTNTGWYAEGSQPSGYTKHIYPDGVNVAKTSSVDGDIVYMYAQWEQSCTHSYSSTVTTAATCTASGVRTYTCSGCGDSYTETIAATGHDYSTSVTAPSCTAGGYTTYVCSGCGDTYTGDTTAAAGHDYEAVVTAPTCTAEGYTTYTCSVCKDTYTGDTTAKADHDYKSVVTAPTCTAEGYTTYTCSVCNDTYTGDTTAKADHDYKAVVTAPTCTAEGYTTYTCSDCGDSYVGDTTAVTGHSYVNGSCSVCGTACAHSWSGGVCTICRMAYPQRDYYLFGYINGADYACEGDHENMGIYKFVDNKLTATFTQDSYVALKAEGNADWYMAYTYLGEDVTAASLFNTKTGSTEKLFVPGGKLITFTLTNNGDDSFTLSYTAKDCPHSEHDASGICAACGQTVSHSYGSVTTDPTCTAAGSTVYTCSVCGDSYSETIAATGHSYGSWGQSKAPTCTENGQLKRTCAVCGSSETQVVAATGHTYESVVTAPTCTEAGYTTYTCASCDDSYTGDTVAATGHDYEGVVTAPTCTEAGYTTYTCASCDDSYTGDTVAATGHDYEGVVTAPTCTEAGYTTYTCAACDDSYTGDTVAATGHSYADGSCTVCGAADPDAVTDPGLTLSYPTLSFEDEIFYNVYYTVGDTTDVEEMGLMLLPSLMQDGTIDDATALIPGYVTNGVAYMARSEGVAAAYMGDTVYFKVYAKLTDGTYAYSNAGGYNAKAYANTVLGGDYTSEMKSLVVAMVNYGAEAQLYFGHNTDKLVNSALTDEQKALVDVYDEAMVDDLVSADSSKTANFVRVSSNFSSLYPSVSFDSAFSINFYCTPAITVDDGMTLYYWDAETYASIDEFTVDNATGSMTMVESNGQYWGNVPGIAAKDMDKTYYVSCVFESEGETVTTGIISYSLGKYCEGKAATDGDAQQTFAQATAVYGYYAKQYFASIA